MAHEAGRRTADRSHQDVSMTTRPTTSPRRTALVTGVGRRAGIGAAIARRLLRDGFDVASCAWSAYDDRTAWGADTATGEELAGAARQVGGRTLAVESDLADPSAIPALYDLVNSELGPVTVLVMAHCESVDSTILTTSLESFDRHFQVNARASWLLIREFARRFGAEGAVGRIVALTSDALAGNVPYGASKGALDRIVLAAAREFADLGVTANVVNPGPTDTGWISDTLRHQLLGDTPGHRLGTPEDAANLVSFLCSSEGGWVNGQLLVSDGGLSAP